MSSSAAPATLSPLDAWYVAAHDVEVSRAVFVRTACELPTAPHRQTDGMVSALEDSCGHRRVPLPLGCLEGDEVVCVHHRFVYNARGLCTHSMRPAA